MRDVQRQICTERSRQHSGETNRNTQEEEIHAGGVPPKSKLVLFSTVHKTVLARTSVMPVLSELPGLTPEISWGFLYCFVLFFKLHRYFYYIPLVRNISY